ncbi:unnamed protein product [Brassica oleracea]
MCLNFMIMATGQVIVEEMNPKSDDQYKLPNDAANNHVLNEKPYIDDTVVESFLAVSWAEKDDTHYILAGGLMCIIRVFFSCLIFGLQTLSGHDDSITDIQCSTFNNAFVLSASQDRTVRFNFYAVLLLLVTDFFQSFFSFFIFRKNITSSVLGTKKLICGLRKITRPKRENKLANP